MSFQFCLAIKNIGDREIEKEKKSDSTFVGHKTLEENTSKKSRRRDNLEEGRRWIYYDLRNYIWKRVKDTILNYLSVKIVQFFLPCKNYIF